MVSDAKAQDINTHTPHIINIAHLGEEFSKKGLSLGAIKNLGIEILIRSQKL